MQFVCSVFDAFGELLVIWVDFFSTVVSHVDLVAPTVVNVDVVVPKIFEPK